HHRLNRRALIADDASRFANLSADLHLVLRVCQILAFRLIRKVVSDHLLRGPEFHLFDIASHYRSPLESCSRNRSRSRVKSRYAPVITVLTSKSKSFFG